MGYKPTGNPPGRPRKTVSEPPMIYVSGGEASVEVVVTEEEAKTEPAPEPNRLSRAREGFRRAAGDPAAALHRPPRFGQRRREVGKRPMLHPNVIAKA